MSIRTAVKNDFVDLLSNALHLSVVKPFWLTALTVSLAVFSHSLFAEQDVVSDDGREVRLHDDGTWSLLSRDRFATTADGRRIKLMPDGRWDEVAQTLTVTDGVTKQVFTPVKAVAGSSGILLTQVDILKKKTKTHKSTKADTRTVYYLQVTNPSAAAITLSQELVSSLAVTDSKGRQYKVLSLAYDGNTIASGESKKITVWVDGAPRWYGVQFLSLEIAKNVFGDNRRIVLSKNMNDVSTRVVADF